MIIDFHTILAIILGLSSVQITHGGKMIMPGEPLNPDIFEKAEKLVEKPLPAGVNDGTWHDIVEPGVETRAYHERYNVKPWSNRIVPYMLDNSFSEQDKVIIAKAITVFQKSTCVRVIARTVEPNYVLVHKENGTDCFSNIGMKGGAQPMGIASRCIQHSGSVVHEFMHALGFYHEQGRPDRDDYLTIHWDNIYKKYYPAFKKVHGVYANDPENGHYDTLSITHYTRTADAIDKKKDSMTPKVGDQLGQREYLTKLDIEKISKFYDCNEEDLNYPDPSKLVPKTPLQPSDTRSLPTNHSSTTLESNGTRESLNLDALLPFNCKDYDDGMCAKLAKYKYCKVNPLFMDVFCKRTCKTCGMGCRDMHKLCSSWATKNYCTKFSDYMFHFCEKSCKQCF